MAKCRCCTLSVSFAIFVLNLCLLSNCIFLANLPLPNPSCAIHHETATIGIDGGPRDF
jgi:hypothetical protein